MHIPDGFLPPSVALAGYALTGGMTWYSLCQIDKEKNPQSKIPKASLLTAAFFLASLIHIPVPPVSIHLVMNGLMGIVLGYYAFPAIEVGLFFQAVMFQHGGLSTLGVNTAMIGIPALVAYYIFGLRNRIGGKQQIWTKIFAFLASAGAIVISASIFAVVVMANISPELEPQTERRAIYASVSGYAVQALIEGTFTVMLVSFLGRVKPELLENQ